MSYSCGLPRKLELVQIFLGGNKVLKNKLMIKYVISKKEEDFFSNFVAFTQYLNFKKKSYLEKGMALILYYCRFVKVVFLAECKKLL